MIGDLVKKKMNKTQSKNHPIETKRKVEKCNQKKKRKKLLNIICYNQMEQWVLKLALPMEKKKRKKKAFDT
jgi:hypothetical protein